MKEEVLSEIAYEFFVKGVDEFPYYDVYKVIKGVMAQSIKAVNEDDILKEICENSGILQKSDSKYLFVHRTFFEYYVAFRFKIKSKDITDIIKYCNDDIWTEPICLYSAMIDSDTDGTLFLDKLSDENIDLAVKCYLDMECNIDDIIIRKLLKSENVFNRVSIVRSLETKVKNQEVIVDIIKELFKKETNGEVIYWAVNILYGFETKKTKQIIYEKLDKGAKDRYEKYVKNDMVKIPEGTFIMGSSKDGDYDDEKPQHEVELDEFYMSKYTVTNNLYELFDPSHKGRRNIYSDEDNQPVLYVNWYEATIFCRWLGCRMPTEAEWEYACRAGTKTKYYFGNELKGKHANFGLKMRKTAKVNEYKPNKFGLYNMHGNTYEWCYDWYNENYYSECINNKTIKNPAGPEKGSERVVRGGSWSGNADNCRSAFRHWGSPGDRYSIVSLRLVFVP